MQFIRKWREALLSVGATLFALLFLEAGARVYLCQFAAPERQQRYLAYDQCGVKSLYSPHHYLDYAGTKGFRNSDGENIHNSLGFRGPEIATPKPKGVYRIALLGGSSTYEVAVHSWKNDWARQLERELRARYGYEEIEVINAGLPGWNTWESLINLELKVVDLEPDLVIIYDSINDIHARLVDPAVYTGDNAGRRKRWSTSVPILWRSTLARMVFHHNPYSLDTFVEAPTSAGKAEWTGYIEAIKGTAAETLAKNKPVFFERNVRSMIAVAREHGAEVLMSTWAYSNQKRDYVAKPHYEAAIAEQNDVLRKIAESHKIPIYDFAAEMPMEGSFWVDGRHVGTKGAKLKGELFAGYIARSKLIDEKIAALKAAK